MCTPYRQLLVGAEARGRLPRGDQEGSLATTITPTPNQKQGPGRKARGRNLVEGALGVRRENTPSSVQCKYM